MDKEFIEKQKQKLLQLKTELEKEIYRLHHRPTGEESSSNLPALPDYDGSLEEEADQVEEYSALLSIDYVFKQELKKIDYALQDIKEGQYGICKNCGKEISRRRLQIYPQARLCKNCTL